MSPCSSRVSVSSCFPESLAIHSRSTPPISFMETTSASLAESTVLISLRGDFLKTGDVAAQRNQNGGLCQGRAGRLHERNGRRRSRMDGKTLWQTGRYTDHWQRGQYSAHLTRNELETQSTISGSRRKRKT